MTLIKCSISRSFCSYNQNKTYTQMLSIHNLMTLIECIWHMDMTRKHRDWAIDEHNGPIFIFHILNFSHSRRRNWIESQFKLNGIISILSRLFFTVNWRLNSAHVRLWDSFHLMEWVSVSWELLSIESNRNVYLN